MRRAPHAAAPANERKHAVIPFKPMGEPAPLAEFAAFCPHAIDRAFSMQPRERRIVLALIAEVQAHRRGMPSEIVRARRDRATLRKATHRRVSVGPPLCPQLSTY